MKVSERLFIKNFSTIEKFDWEVKEFNVLTGGMGSGKSICVKLLWFFERIFHTLIFHSTITKDDLHGSVFFDRIGEKFEDIFHIEKFDFRMTEINYTYSCNGNIFDLQAAWSESRECLLWASNYLNSRFEQWQGFFEVKNTTVPQINISEIVSERIFESISKDFHNTFPIGPMFIPASRAITTITDNTDFLDPFIVQFIKDTKRLISLFERFSNESANKILHIKNIRYDKERGLIITLQNGCEISPRHLSSGQQELLPMLLMINYLKHIIFNLGYPSLLAYANRTSVFIEEPEAHLFPQDQKETIEYIVEVFRLSKNKSRRGSERFFLTTHSPYILNIVSTMMNRGALKKNLDELGENSLGSQYYFDEGEVSAHFIHTDGKVTSMVSKDGRYINAEEINDISEIIFNEANSVDEELVKVKIRNAK